MCVTIELNRLDRIGGDIVKAATIQLPMGAYNYRSIADNITNVTDALREAGMPAAKLEYLGVVAQNLNAYDVDRDGLLSMTDLRQVGEIIIAEVAKAREWSCPPAQLPSARSTPPDYPDGGNVA